MFGNEDMMEVSPDGRQQSESNDKSHFVDTFLLPPIGEHCVLELSTQLWSDQSSPQHKILNIFDTTAVHNFMFWDLPFAEGTQVGRKK